ILAFICDNTSNNDVMIERLAEHVPKFMGAASQTHCFLHVVNLVAKMLVLQFNTKKALEDDELAE
ncbi:hypothetical protein BS17DRAFT_639536, partial [Gyrodon lividus]